MVIDTSSSLPLPSVSAPAGAGASSRTGAGASSRTAAEVLLELLELLELVELVGLLELVMSLLCAGGCADVEGHGDWRETYDTVRIIAELLHARVVALSLYRIKHLLVLGTQEVQGGQCCVG